MGFLEIIMADRLAPHYPTKAPVKTVDAIENQRIYDQRIMQDNIIRIFDQLAEIPFLNKPSFLENQEISTTETLIEHKLGRTVRGYIICNKDTFSDIKDNITATTADLSLYLPLIAESTVTVSLIIF